MFQPVHPLAGPGQGIGHRRHQGDQISQNDEWQGETDAERYEDRERHQSALRQSHADGGGHKGRGAGRGDNHGQNASQECAETRAFRRDLEATDGLQGRTDFENARHVERHQQHDQA